MANSDLSVEHIFGGSILFLGDFDLVPADTRSGVAIQSWNRNN